MRESNYWLRLMKELIEEVSEGEELSKLIKESEELKNILGSIVLKTSNDKGKR